jgi:hypothetical protein
MKQCLRAIPRANSMGLDDFFLDQLRVLIARQRAARTQRERVALSQAAFAVFLDCHDIGLATEAQALVGQLMDEAAVDTARARRRQAGVRYPVDPRSHRSLRQQAAPVPA